MQDDILVELGLDGCDWRPIEGAELRERVARRRALKAALRKAVGEPLALHALGASTCVILFGQFAYVNREGVLAEVQHDQGVLTEVPGSFPEPVNSLPVMPTAAGIRELAKCAIYREAARSLAAWGGGLVDLTGNWDSDWTPGFSPIALTALMEMDAQFAVSLVPMAVWGQIAKRFCAMLAVDRTLVRTSRWAIVGASNPLDAYEQLRRSAFTPSDISSGAERRLVAPAISASIDAQQEHRHVDDAVKWFRARLTRFGVRASGFALLSNTPLKYWCQRMRFGGYDFATMATTLLIGQRLGTPTLPDPEFVEAICNINFESELDPCLRNVSPRIWRQAYQRFCAGPSAAKGELLLVIPWAARLGATLPNVLQSHDWETLLEHASGAITAGEMVEPVSIGRQQTPTLEDGVVKASLMRAERAVDAISQLMDLDIESMRPEIEAGTVKVFRAREKNKRAAIFLRAQVAGTGWEVLQVLGNGDKRPDPCFVSFARRLCRWYKRMPGA